MFYNQNLKSFFLIIPFLPNCPSNLIKKRKPKKKKMLVFDAFTMHSICFYL